MLPGNTYNQGYTLYMKQILGIFFKAEGTKPWLVVACLLLASLTEAAGIGTLLPAANAVVGNNSNTSGGPRNFLKSII